MPLVERQEDSAGHVFPVRRDRERRNEGSSTGREPLRAHTFTRTELQKEMRYVKDPVKLAEVTLRILRQGDTQSALNVVRHASKSMNCTVAWNHIVDKYMTNGKTTPAIKTFNEVSLELSCDDSLAHVHASPQMKKRQQPPDAYTYTILLRGLADRPQYLQSLPRALSIYNSMSASNSPVKPSIIHTNAVLNVCARAQDVDMMFTVAANLPNRGKGAPDNMTFTTILNAVRSQMWNDGNNLKGETDEEKTARRQQGVNQARRMWEDIIGRWRQGDLKVDEELVCAMGRVLLLGGLDRDYDDVLSLLAQTMNVPRPVATLQEKDAEREAQREEQSRSRNVKRELNEAEHLLLSDVESTETKSTGPSASIATQALSSEQELPLSEFAPITLPTNTRIAHARPGRNTLSMAIDACIRLRSPTAAQIYWSQLTERIEPDQENYHMYLRLLRLRRAAGPAVELVEEMSSPGGVGVSPKTYRIAMSACTRSAETSKHSVRPAARRLIQSMKQHLEEPDLKTCQMYLALIMKSNEDKVVGPPPVPDPPSSTDSTTTWRRNPSFPHPAGRNTTTNWRLLWRDVTELNDCVANLKSLLQYGTLDENPPSTNDLQPHQPSTIDTADPDEFSTSRPKLKAKSKAPKKNPGGTLTFEKKPLHAQAGTSVLTEQSKTEIRTFIRKLVAVYDKIINAGGEEMGSYERNELRKTKSRLVVWNLRMLEGGRGRLEKQTYIRRESARGKRVTIRDADGARLDQGDEDSVGIDGQLYQQG
ncbi:hypothetical protein MMC09_004420 [Bachmanniomyces sp. S44760]|nr:hypothetical protein [Bachmanniomyces sp. S44760]